MRWKTLSLYTPIFLLSFPFLLTLSFIYHDFLFSSFLSHTPPSVISWFLSLVHPASPILLPFLPLPFTFFFLFLKLYLLPLLNFYYFSFSHSHSPQSSSSFHQLVFFYISFPKLPLLQPLIFYHPPSLSYSFSLQLYASFFLFLSTSTFYVLNAGKQDKQNRFSHKLI